MRPRFLMTAREAFVIDRIKVGQGVGVIEALNGHWPRTAPAKYVSRRDLLEAIWQFHSPLSIAGKYPGSPARPYKSRQLCRLRCSEYHLLIPAVRENSSIENGFLPPTCLANGGVMKQSEIFLENAEHCAHLAESSNNEPAYRRYKRMEASWRALAHEQDWLDGEIMPTHTANGPPPTTDVRR
jgi:hypothetical protein